MVMSEYLKDMKTLVIDVVDAKRKPIGRGNMNLEDAVEMNNLGFEGGVALKGLGKKGKQNNAIGEIFLKLSCVFLGEGGPTTGGAGSRSGARARKSAMLSSFQKNEMLAGSDFSDTYAAWPASPGETAGTGAPAFKSTGAGVKKAPAPRAPSSTSSPCAAAAEEDAPVATLPQLPEPSIAPSRRSTTSGRGKKTPGGTSSKRVSIVSKKGDGGDKENAVRSSRGTGGRSRDRDGGDSSALESAESTTQTNSSLLETACPPQTS
jgi:hypothetical protein